MKTSIIQTAIVLLIFLLIAFSLPRIYTAIDSILSQEEKSESINHRIFYKSYDELNNTIRQAFDPRLTFSKEAETPKLSWEKQFDIGSKLKNATLLTVSATRYVKGLKWNVQFEGGNISEVSQDDEVHDFIQLKPGTQNDKNIELRRIGNRNWAIFYSLPYPPIYANKIFKTYDSNLNRFILISLQIPVTLPKDSPKKLLNYSEYETHNFLTHLFSRNDLSEVTQTIEYLLSKLDK